MVHDIDISLCFKGRRYDNPSEPKSLYREGSRGLGIPNTGNTSFTWHLTLVIFRKMGGQQGNHQIYWNILAMICHAINYNVVNINSINFLVTSGTLVLNQMCFTGIPWTTNTGNIMNTVL